MTASNVSAGAFPVLELRDLDLGPALPGQLGHPRVGLHADTRQPAAWNSRAEMPVPHPTSRTSRPGLAAMMRSTRSAG